MDRRIGSVLGLAVLLLPVLPSRQLLHDHSAAQVLVGALIGAVFGGGYFVVLHFHGASWLNSLQLPTLDPTDAQTSGNWPLQDGTDDCDNGSVVSARSSCFWIYDDYSQNTPLGAGGGVLRKSHSEGDLRKRRAAEMQPS